MALSVRYQVTNPDGTVANISAQPPGFPPAPAGSVYRNPDPGCDDSDCGGSCWAIMVPATVPAEQFAHDLTAWAVRLSQGG
jgi:hypothetical protein